MIHLYEKNVMGTVSFKATFKGMRKPQEFVVYPLQAGDTSNLIVIQSDTRIGAIGLADGTVLLSDATSRHPGRDLFTKTSRYVGKLPADQLLLLKSNIMATASGKTNPNGVVHCDNSAALDVFG